MASHQDQPPRPLPPPENKPTPTKRPFESTSSENPAQKLRKIIENDRAGKESPGPSKMTPGGDVRNEGVGRDSGPNDKMAPARIPQPEEPIRKTTSEGGAKRVEPAPPAAGNKSPPSMAEAKVPPSSNESAKPVEAPKPETVGNAQVLKLGGEVEKENEAGNEGGEKEALAGRRVLRPRQASAPPQGQRSRLRYREGETG